MTDHEQSILDAAMKYRDARWRVQAALNRMTDIGADLSVSQRNQLVSYRMAAEDFNVAKQAESMAQMGLLMTICPMGTER
jgi:hypothetical protein